MLEEVHTGDVLFLRNPETNVSYLLRPFGREYFSEINSYYHTIQYAVYKTDEKGNFIRFGLMETDSSPSREELEKKIQRIEERGVMDEVYWWKEADEASNESL